jgi:CRISPR-associated protein Csm3
MKLKGYKNIEGIIEVITGLHIGGSTSIIEIGGKDNPVIKHPLTKEPYIPGSSIKGKMRSLLEWKLGLIDDKEKISGENNKDYGGVHKYNGPNCQQKKCPICVIFGTSADDAGLGPTRIVVRDAVLDEDFKNRQREKDSAWTVLDLTEDKYENTINRITARANPRNFERVISGVEFSFGVSYRVFENGDNGNLDENLFKHVIEGLKLIEKDALGGAGSRGCGQVRFKIKIGDKHEYLENINSSNINSLFPTELETIL